MDTVRKTYIIWAKVTDTFEFLRFTHIFRNTNKLFWNFSNKNSMFDKKISVKTYSQKQLF